MIGLYIVGIHFNQVFDFVPDTPNYTKPFKQLPDGSFEKSGPPEFMSGQAILEAAAMKYGLRYVLATSAIYPQPRHIEYVSYTPTRANDKNPRVTLGSSFPFYGQTLSLAETLAPIGQASQVLQYSAQWLKTAPGPFPTPAPVTLNNTGPKDPMTDPNFPVGFQSDAAFGSNAFSDKTEIRIRLMSIFCTY